MAKARTVHRCESCGAVAARWTGRCPTCGEWNSLVVETVLPAPGPGAAPPLGAPVQPVADVEPLPATSCPTGIAELDRVLGGGLVPGSVTLLGGEPGIGKSTLLMQALAALSRAGRRCLLASGEESAQQVRLRAGRVDAVVDGLWLTAESSLPAIIAAVDELHPDVLVVDSIQTAVDPEVGTAPGTVSQVQGCATRLVREAKSRGISVVLVGHVIKDGSLAGPRLLEHVVDTVLTFEGERHHALRLLRAMKHRFGPTGELGLFEMADSGLTGIPDPSGLFLGDRQPGVAGSAVVAAMEGQRPLLVEIQALVIKSNLPQPRRSGLGLDNRRLGVLLAVLERRADLPFGARDVYVSAVGGVRVVEPAADLGVALALVSAISAVPLPPDVIAFGEVGLAGEIRQVARSGPRLAEAARLGFKQAIVPRSAPDGPCGIDVRRVGTIGEAVVALAGRHRLAAVAPM
jgi:DNA repair protein RadA/Sms